MTVTTTPDGAPQAARELVETLAGMFNERLAELGDARDRVEAEGAAQAAALMALLRARLGLYSDEYLVMVSKLAAQLDTQRLATTAPARDAQSPGHGTDGVVIPLQRTRRP